MVSYTEDIKEPEICVNNATVPCCGTILEQRKSSIIFQSVVVKILILCLPLFINVESCNVADNNDLVSHDRVIIVNN